MNVNLCQHLILIFCLILILTFRIWHICIYSLNLAISEPIKAQWKASSKKILPTLKALFWKSWLIVSHYVMWCILLQRYKNNTDIFRKPRISPFQQCIKLKMCFGANVTDNGRTSINIHLFRFWVLWVFSVLDYSKFKKW